MHLHGSYAMYDSYEISYMCHKPPSLNECFFGSVTVGERGQIVLPAEARALFNINPGDKVLVMRHPLSQGLMIVQIDALVDFAEEFRAGVQEIKERESSSE